MSSRIFFLGWQARESRAWFPIGRLDAPQGGGAYEFGYSPMEGPDFELINSDEVSLVS